MQTMEGRRVGMRGYVQLLFMVIGIVIAVSGGPSFGGEEEKVQVDVCTLLTQEEVDSLFSEPAGPGRSGSVVPGVRECVWPGEGLPKFILQVIPSSSIEVRKSIDPGEGYRVLDIEGLSGEAAIAIQEANPRYGLKEGVAILGIKAGEVILTFSPVHLDIREGSPQWELLKKLADSAAGRMERK